MKTNTLHPQWILVARIGWVLMTLFFLTTFISGLPYRHSELATACDAPACPILTLSSADADLINSTPFSMQGCASFHIGLELITALTMSVMASLIFWKYFDNWMGIFTAYLLIYIGLAIFVQASLAFAVQYPPVEWPYNQLSALFVPLILLVVFIFPNSQFLNNLSLAAFIIAVFLWALDLILIQITVQYGVVSVLLGAVYFGSITVIQGGLTAVAEAQSPLAIVLSTLLIATLFNPLRRRVQAFIDRRFYRQKYDAQQILAQFAQTARDEVEMDVLQAELVQVVQETMQPEQISVWVKPVTRLSYRLADDSLL